MADESLPSINLVPAEETTVDIDEGPGTLLRKKRQKTKFEINDVAIHLHLAPKVIEAIESNDFSHAPNRVFVRGYLRAYAKLLGIDPEEILSAYDKLGISDAPVPIATDVIYKKNKGLFEMVAPWFFTLLIGGMIFLVIFLWYSQHNDVSTTLLPNAEPASSQSNQPQNKIDVLHPATTQSPSSPNNANGTQPTTTVQSPNINSLPADHSVIPTTAPSNTAADPVTNTPSQDVTAPPMNGPATTVTSTPDNATIQDTNSDTSDSTITGSGAAQNNPAVFPLDTLHQTTNGATTTPSDSNSKPVSNSPKPSSNGNQGGPAKYKAKTPSVQLQSPF